MAYGLELYAANGKLNFAANEKLSTIIFSATVLVTVLYSNSYPSGNPQTVNFSVPDLDNSGTFFVEIKWDDADFELMQAFSTSPHWLHWTISPGLLTFHYNNFNVYSGYFEGQTAQYPINVVVIKVA
ncbi:MAG: hypothetical protein WBC07_08575 [Methylotenera sp.]